MAKAGKILDLEREKEWGKARRGSLGVTQGQGTKGMGPLRGRNDIISVYWNRYVQYCQKHRTQTTILNFPKVTVKESYWGENVG